MNPEEHGFLSLVLRTLRTMGKGRKVGMKETDRRKNLENFLDALSAIYTKKACNEKTNLRSLFIFTSPAVNIKHTVSYKVETRI